VLSRRAMKKREKKDMQDSQDLRIETEQVDDVPVLLAQMEKMGIAKLLDEHFLRNRGNRPLEVREAEHLAAEEMKQDYELPASLQNLEGILDTSGGRSRR